MVYDLQKASLWKRIAAWLFDSILVGVLAVGAAFLLSASFGYDSYSDAVGETYDHYESVYNVSFEATQEEYNSWPEEERANYDAAYEALISDEEAMYAYNIVVNLTLLISSFSILAAIVLMELVIPLLLKNGQTLGKKIFGICLVRTDCVRISGVQLFIRTILGKFAVETMIPVFAALMLFWGLAGPFALTLLGILLAAEGLCLLLNRRNAAIHDLLAGTCAADYTSQMIFADAEKLVEYQKKIHAELAARQEY